jgi:hypothetical protein
MASSAEGHSRVRSRRFGRAARFKGAHFRNRRDRATTNMTDELALNKAAERGARAQRLLEDDLLAEALDTLDRDYTRAWRATAARDTDARERLWQAVQVVAKVRDHLVHIVNGGKLAQRQMNDLAGRHKASGTT